ncbi:MAG: hypothetical protein KGL11_10055 [Alphaproteobacteria bacterium]|nr:hypothetical protein [Alphaproteobacteria bacterium]
MKKSHQSVDKHRPTSIKITPAMVEAGIAAWRAEVGDEFPVVSLGTDETVRAIYRAMDKTRTAHRS